MIPTYKREKVLLDTITCLTKLEPAPSEIVVVDQTERHDPVTMNTLIEWDAAGAIRWVRLTRTSIPHAMNVGLMEAKNNIVLFLDDDIIPDQRLLEAHFQAHLNGHNIVAGQVLQPGEEPLRTDVADFRFCSGRRQLINEFIGCNFSVKRRVALELGGFDENFVHVAYRFEAEFAGRAIAAGEKIFFDPAASIRHLKAKSGGTRSFGEHLRTIKPSHCVGEYYYFMRSKRGADRFMKIITRPFRAVKTRHHLKNPWWIPLTMLAELLGIVWAGALFVRGPRYLAQAPKDGRDD